MTKPSTDDGMQFLTVQEAARALGQSRLRVREAVARGLLKARRDNEGRLRIDLTDDPQAAVTAGQSGVPELAPDAVVGFLFDEIEELETVLSDRDARIAVLSDLLERQAEMLDRADTALNAAEENQTRLSALLDRALSHLEADGDATERLAGVSDRALTRLESVGDELETSLGQSARFEELLSRAVEIAEGAGEPGAMGTTAARAMSLLGDAVTRAEAGQAAADQTGAMLGRALAAGERMQREIASRDAQITHQQETIESALSMSERAVELAAKADTPLPRKGFWRRMLGL